MSLPREADCFESLEEQPVAADPDRRNKEVFPRDSFVTFNLLGDVENQAIKVFFLQGLAGK
jgi:hypothetical protein